jgi:hypothetical protein
VLITRPTQISRTEGGWGKWVIKMGEKIIFKDVVRGESERKNP